MPLRVKFKHKRHISAKNADGSSVTQKSSLVDVDALEVSGDVLVYEKTRDNSRTFVEFPYKDSIVITVKGSYSGAAKDEYIELRRK